MGRSMASTMLVVFMLGLTVYAADEASLVHSVFDDVVPEMDVEPTELIAAEIGDSEDVVGAITALKAYCVAARPILTDGKLSKSRRNVPMFLIDKFGTTKKGTDIVTEYAQTIGTMEANDFPKGIGKYLLNHINKSILSGQTVLFIQKNEVIFDHAKLGLREKPDYLMALKVKISEWSAQESKIHEGKGGAAIKAWIKSGQANSYQQHVDAISARYMALKEAHDQQVEAGAKVAIGASFQAGTKKGHKGADVMQPLPVAGKEGAHTVRKNKPFVMPTAEEIKKEAMAKAMEDMKDVAKKAASADAVVKRIEAELVGVKITVKTNVQLFSESTQTPKVEIYGTTGTIKGAFKALPQNGGTYSQVFTSPQGTIGTVKRVHLFASGKNPWLCDEFYVQVGHGNPSIEFLPQGLKHKKTFWLDSKKGNEGPYFNKPKQSEWLLLPSTQDVKYTMAKKFSGKSPKCTSIKCFSADRSAVEAACEKDPACEGYSYTEGDSKSGEGCLKKLCRQGEGNDARAAEWETGMDYYEKRGYSLIMERKEKAKEKEDKAKAKAKEIESKKPKLELHCAMKTASSNKAGVVRVTKASGTMTGGGINNHYRSWDKKAGFEESYPEGNKYRCDMGFGPGQVTCYGIFCNVYDPKKKVTHGLDCTTKSTSFDGSGARAARLPAGYTMTGGGLNNHYRSFNKKAGFEDSRPVDQNGWLGDMGFGPGKYTAYVRGCKGLTCKTVTGKRGNTGTATCPSGYQVTGCGIKNYYRKWKIKSGFEQTNPKGNGCFCDGGFGAGDVVCYARCCKAHDSFVAPTKAPTKTPTKKPTKKPTVSKNGQIKVRQGKCLDASQRNKAGGKVHIWDCNINNLNQQWNYQPNLAGQIRVKQGKCLDASQRNKKGGKVHIWDCNTGNKNQQWAYTHSTGQIKAKHGKCLDASQRNKVGGLVHMWNCDTNNLNQQWVYSP